jgi:hypothetical protein
MSADSVPSSKTNIFQNKLIYCRHFRSYSRCAMLDWSDTVFRRRNVTRRRISNTVLQPRYWGSEADSPEVCRLPNLLHITRFEIIIFIDSSMEISTTARALVFDRKRGVLTTKSYPDESNSFMKRACPFQQIMSHYIKCW